MLSKCFIALAGGIQWKQPLFLVIRVKLVQREGGKWTYPAQGFYYLSLSAFSRPAISSMEENHVFPRSSS